MNKLLQLISKGGLKDAGAMLKWAAAMSMQFMPGSEKNLNAQRNSSAWEEVREDILIFIEKNISKLEKQKVASRAKYQEYDEYYSNYLIAEKH